MFQSDGIARTRTANGRISEVNSMSRDNNQLLTVAEILEKLSSQVEQCDQAHGLIKSKYSGSGGTAMLISTN